MFHLKTKLFLNLYVELYIVVHFNGTDPESEKESNLGYQFSNFFSIESSRNLFLTNSYIDYQRDHHNWFLCNKSVNHS